MHKGCFHFRCSVLLSAICGYVHKSPFICWGLDGSVVNWLTHFTGDKLLLWSWKLPGKILSIFSITFYHYSHHQCSCSRTTFDLHYPVIHATCPSTFVLFSNSHCSSAFIIIESLLPFIPWNPRMALSSNCQRKWVQFYFIPSQVSIHSEWSSWFSSSLSSLVMQINPPLYSSIRYFTCSIHRTTHEMTFKRRVSRHLTNWYWLFWNSTVHYLHEQHQQDSFVSVFFSTTSFPIKKSKSHWPTISNNKFYALKPVVSPWNNPYCYRWWGNCPNLTVNCHTRLTHSYLMAQDSSV